jgi:hypothetical protein
LPLPSDEQRQLRGHSHRFCAIHSYLDGQRGQALRHWWLATTNLGLAPPLLVLLGKIVVGRTAIGWAKQHLARAQEPKVA